jgi:hypothetical protein
MFNQLHSKQLSADEIHSQMRIREAKETAMTSKVLKDKEFAMLMKKPAKQIKVYDSMTNLSSRQLKSVKRNGRQTMKRLKSQTLGSLQGGLFSKEKLEGYKNSLEKIDEITDSSPF